MTKSKLTATKFHMNIVNLLENSGLKESAYGPKFTGFEKEIGSVFGAKNIGFHLEVLNPKTFSCPYHYHELEEELVYVIEGEAIVRKNNEYRKLKAGDLIYYETGLESAHHIYNHSNKPFKFLVLSTKFPEENCFYPDSKKKLNKKTRTVTQEGLTVDYWKDEEDPSIHWPDYALRGDVP